MMVAQRQFVLMALIIALRSPVDIEETPAIKHV
jgi:hypothetical protein